MFSFHRSKSLPIGLDLGHDSVRLMQLSVAGGAGVAIRAATRFGVEIAPIAPASGDPWPAIASKIAQAARAIKSAAFDGSRIVSALPRSIVHIRNLRVPAGAKSDLPAAVAFEARGVFPFDLGEATLRYLMAGEIRQGSDTRQEVIAFAARTADVDRFLELLHASGFEPVAFDIEPAALFRGCRGLGPANAEGPDESTAIIDIGLRRTLMVIGREGQMTFVKPVSIGGRTFNDAVSRKLGISRDEASSLRRRLANMGTSSNAISDVEAPSAKHDPVRRAVFDATRSTVEELGRELSMCLRYHSVTFRGQRPMRLLVTGGESFDSLLHRRLAAIVGLSVEAARPIEPSPTMPATERAPYSDWAIALGLALKDAPAQANHAGALTSEIASPIQEAIHA
jgi:type IV pilus assembly protein PilM